MALFNFDLAGAEWVLVAYLANDQNMIDVVRSGKSPHTVTGALISGLSEEMVLKDHKLIGDQTNPDEIQELRREHLPELEAARGQPGIFIPRSMSIRQAGKKSNHGLNYDMQYRRFALENEMPENDAKAIHELYNTKAYPGLPGWRRGIQTELKTNARVLTNPLGRKVRLLDEWGSDLLMAAYSFKPQSTVGDIVNEALVKIYRSQDPEFKDMLPGWAQKHDSLLLQSHSKSPYLGLWASTVRRLMSPLLTINGHEFRLGVDMKVGWNWGDMKEVPWTPDPVQLQRDISEALSELRPLASAHRSGHDLVAVP